jgi:patatin-like phospholipase/acyl hydrolase
LKKREEREEEKSTFSLFEMKEREEKDNKEIFLHSTPKKGKEKTRNVIICRF